MDEGDRRRTFLDETDFVSGPVLVTFNMFLVSPTRQNEGEGGNRTGDEPKMTVLCKSDERGAGPELREVCCRGNFRSLSF